MATNTSGAALIGDGSNFNPVVISGDVSIATNGAASLAAAQTNITSILATDVKIGEDDQTKIDFETADEIQIMRQMQSKYLYQTEFLVHKRR